MFEQLAYSLGRNDETPNIELAIRLSENEDAARIHEIVSGLTHKNQAIANDCIKVLYEIGDRKPKLIAEYVDDFVSLLSSKNNRLVWGGMTALATIADLNPDAVYTNVDRILSAYHHGSVITVDKSITVFAKLCKVNRAYMERLFPLLIDHLKKCRAKEVPQHAERAAICVDKMNMNIFIEALAARKEELSDLQKARIEKFVRALGKKLS